MLTTMPHHGETLKKLYKRKGFTQAQAAEKLGISASTIKYKLKETTFDDLFLEKVCVTFGISKSTFMGDKNLSNIDPNQIQEVDFNGKPNVIVVNLEALAGYPENFQNAVWIKDLPQIHLPYLPDRPHFMFAVKGDSMEPWVYHGDYVVAEQIELKYAVKNYPHVLVTKEGLVLKRLKKIDKDTLTLRSDNSNYPDMEVEAAELLQVFQVVIKQSHNMKEIS